MAEGGGCTMLVGLAIAALAVGSIFGEPWGWLVVGGGLVTLGVMFRDA